jgi:hypothetical protein
MYRISTESIGDVKKYVWHYRKDNKEYGPFTYEDIVELVKKGDIGPEDYLLKFGNRKFFKASEVQGLFNGIVQEEVKQEELKQEELKQEEQVVIPEEKIEVIKEDINRVFENRTEYLHTHHKKTSSGNKVIIIAAGLMGLCLVAWVLIRLL